MKKPRVSEESKVIGKNLRHLRKNSHLSQMDMARLLNVTFQQIQKYEQGQNRLPIEKLHFLKNHFNQTNFPKAHSVSIDTETFASQFTPA